VHATIEHARQELKKFDDAPNDQHGRQALANGLGELSDVKSSSSDEKISAICVNLINTYRKKVEEAAQNLINEKSSANLDVLKHWYDVMNEFQSLELEVTDEFFQIKTQLQFEYIAKLVKQFSPSEKQRLRELLQ